jgi:4-hydroxybenzoate polyprenyltransferase
MLKFIAESADTIIRDAGGYRREAPPGSSDMEMNYQATLDSEATGRVTRLQDVFALLRIHQWIKNCFVLTPLFFSRHFFDIGYHVRILPAFAAFCLISSAVYVLNDLMDREADAHHPEKRQRPLAAGRVSVRAAISLIAVLAAAGLSAIFWTTPLFMAILLLYIVINVIYCFVSKHYPLADIFSIASGFVLRVLAGGAQMDIHLSPWILICTGLLALFLAVCKRRDDLILLGRGNGHRKSVAGYSVALLDGFIFVLVAAIIVSYSSYSLNHEVQARLGSERIYLTIPYIVFGCFRYMQICMVYNKTGSPTKVLLSDKWLLLNAILWTTTFGILLYWPDHVIFTIGS